MGGCCSSGKVRRERAPVFFYCPPILEEHEPLSFTHSTITQISSGVLVDTNLDTSSPDTYRAPPPPLPYDALVQALHAHRCEASATCESWKEMDGNEKSNVVDGSADSAEKESVKGGDSICSAIEEEDACAICLEEYDKENPKIVTKCDHHFHLACILEWMERSDTCPMCDQVVISVITNSNSIEENFSFQPL